MPRSFRGHYCGAAIMPHAPASGKARHGPVFPLSGMTVFRDDWRYLTAARAMRGQRRALSELGIF
jgi:hypothetical protein